MGLEDLSQVHTGRNAERRQDDIDRGAVLHEWHVLFRKDLGDNALVAMTPGELVACRDLALLGNVDTDEFVHARRQVEAVFAAELLNGDGLTTLAVRNLERHVTNLASLLTEDGSEQTLFRCQFGLTLRCDLADEVVAGTDFGADADDAAVVQITEHLFGDIRDVPGDFLGTKLGVTSIDLVLFDVDRSE